MKKLKNGENQIKNVTITLKGKSIENAPITDCEISEPLGAVEQHPMLDVPNEVEFDVSWDNTSEILPKEDPLIAEYEEHWQRLKKTADKNGDSVMVAVGIGSDAPAFISFGIGTVSECVVALVKLMRNMLDGLRNEEAELAAASLRGALYRYNKRRFGKRK